MYRAQRLSKYKETFAVVHRKDSAATFKQYLGGRYEWRVACEKAEQLRGQQSGEFMAVYSKLLTADGEYFQ